MDNSLARRENVYQSIVSVWEKTRWPKGFSTPDKKYFYKMDRSRHFASRRPDMSYLIHDEQLLDIESYQKKLKQYNIEFNVDY